MSHDKITPDHLEDREAMHTGMASPKGNWWVPAHRAEKIWFGIAFAWCMVLFAMMPLSGVFYPVAALPGPLQPIAQVLPTTHVFTAGRTLVAGGPMPWDELAVAAAGTAVMVGAALAFLVWMLRVFRRRGFITRYS